MHQCAHTIRLRNINRETRRLLALSPAVQPPQTLPDILHEDSFPVFLEGAAALARGERFFHTETTLRKKDGSLLYALSSVTPWIGNTTTSYERFTFSIIDHHTTQMRRGRDSLP
jgi:hypothetical protein